MKGKCLSFVWIGELDEKEGEGFGGYNFLCLNINFKGKDSKGMDLKSLSPLILLITELLKCDLSQILFWTLLFGTFENGCFPGHWMEKNVSLDLFLTHTLIKKLVYGSILMIELWYLIKHGFSQLPHSTLEKLWLKPGNEEKMIDLYLSIWQLEQHWHWTLKHV